MNEITEERGPCLQIEYHYLHSAACLHQHQELLAVQEGISTEEKHMFYTDNTTISKLVHASSRNQICKGYGHAENAHEDTIATGLRKQTWEAMIDVKPPEVH